MTDAAAILGTLVAAPLRLHLYLDKEAGNYIEPDRGGYEAKKIPAADWNITEKRARATEQRFKFTGPVGLVRGWFLTGAHRDEILAAGAFEDGPYSIQTRGGTIRVQPEITLET